MTTTHFEIYGGEPALGIVEMSFASQSKYSFLIIPYTCILLPHVSMALCPIKVGTDKVRRERECWHDLARTHTMIDFKPFIIISIKTSPFMEKGEEVVSGLLACDPDSTVRFVMQCRASFKSVCYR